MINAIRSRNLTRRLETLEDQFRPNEDSNTLEIVAVESWTGKVIHQATLIVPRPNKGYLRTPRWPQNTQQQMGTKK
jgi:hypothetical protein